VRQGEDLILYCYELAEIYRQDPAVFRKKPVSEMLRDIHWTSVLAERRQGMRPPTEV
jgi:hypothetical protein